MDPKTSEALKHVKTFKKAISKKIKIDKLIVFGSAAAGKIGKHSDIDILLISREFKKMEFEARGPPLYLDWPSDRPFDLICLTPEEVKARKKHPGLVQEALADGIEI